MDTRSSIAALEGEIEHLLDEVERCRKTVLVGQVVVYSGIAALAAATWLGHGFLFVSSVVAGLGGIVLAGSTRATRDHLLEKLSNLDAERAAAIDSLSLTGVSTGENSAPRSK